MLQERQSLGQLQRGRKGWRIVSFMASWLVPHHARYASKDSDLVVGVVSFSLPALFLCITSSLSFSRPSKTSMYRLPYHADSLACRQQPSISLAHSPAGLAAPCQERQHPYWMCQHTPLCPIQNSNISSSEIYETYLRSTPKYALIALPNRLPSTSSVSVGSLFSLASFHRLRSPFFSCVCSA